MRVFWDTNIFVYRFEENGVLSLQASALWERMEARGDILISSVLTLGELLAGTAQSDPNTADMTRRLLLSTTSMSPGPNSVAIYPKDFIEKNLGHLPEETLRKLLQTNSSKLYDLAV